MLAALKRIINVVLIAAVSVIFILFAVNNRLIVTISLFPLPYEADLPLFILAILAFALGVITGGLIISLKFSKARRLARAEHKRVVALENEITALHNERQCQVPAVAAK